MNKEKLFQLRKRINKLFFKKIYQNEKLLSGKEYLGISL